MDILLQIAVLSCILKIGHTQSYSFVEEGLDTPKEILIDTSAGATKAISLPCTFREQNLHDDWLNGIYSITWTKSQASFGDNDPPVILNHGFKEATDLPGPIASNLEYKQAKQDPDKMKTEVTILNPRPEDSGLYQCKLYVNNVEKGNLTYTVSVSDLSQFDVVLYVNDNPKGVSMNPNTAEWPVVSSLSLKEKMDMGNSPKKYAYLACAARNTPLKTVLDVTIHLADGTTDNSHGHMGSVYTRETIGNVSSHKALRMSHIVETRQFPVKSKNDGATVKCVARIEDNENKELKKKKVPTATLR